MFNFRILVLFRLPPLFPLLLPLILGLCGLCQVDSYDQSTVIKMPWIGQHVDQTG